jgi:HlyD family secretion protein
MKLSSLNFKSKQFIGLAILGLGGVGLVAGLAMAQFGGRSTSKANAKLDEFTVVAKREKLELKVKASGSITPRQTVNLSPKSAGKVQELLVEQGDFVQQGQVVARMDASDLERDRTQALAQVAAAEARLQQLRSPNRPELVKQAETEVDRSKGDVLRANSDVVRAEGEIARVEGVIADAESQRDFANSQYDRQKKLHEERAISDSNLEDAGRKKQNAQKILIQAKAQLKQAKAQRDQALALVEQANAQVVGTQAKAEQQDQSGSSGDISVQEAQVTTAVAQVKAIDQKIEDTSIRAPFSGLVTQRYASVGAFVTPTTQASAASSGSGATSTSIIAVASELEVIAKVPEVDIAAIKANLAADVTVDTFPGESFKGQVRLISPEAIEERDVRFFQVKLKLLSGQKQLRSGMNADLEFAGPESEAILVPTVAIVTKKGRPGVLVPDADGKPTFKPVTVGSSQSGRVRGKRKKKDAAGEKSGEAAGGKPAEKPSEKPAEKPEDKTQGKTQVLDGLNDGDRVFVKLPDGVKLDEIVKDEKDKK